MPVAKEIYHAMDDPKMQKMVIDTQEKRERTLADGTKVPHLYVHGAIPENEIKFILCIPEKENYEGRFFQYLSPFPGPDEEVASLDKTGEDDRIAFALTHGAYFVESNMGSKFAFGGAADPTLCWKASAAVAEHSRKFVMDLYGVGRPYGYVYGGSGGGYKSMACIENTDAWDGACPYVIGSPVSLPNTITMHVQGQRRLRHAFGKIVDALDVGGSGNPYENLNDSEAAMLKELTQMGFPPKVWFEEAYGTVDPGSLPVLTPGVKQHDPSYFTDFWTVPGYLGADPNSQEVKDRLQFTGKVKSVHLPDEESQEAGGQNGVDDAWRKQLTSGNGAWIELEELPEGEDLYLEGVTIELTTGKAVGKPMLLDKMIREPGKKSGYLTIGLCYGMTDIAEVIGSIEPGDTLTMDNSEYIALQSYYRHQVPADLSFHAWDQFRDEQGNPTIPQRKDVMGYGFTGTGTVQDGNIQGKTIITQSLMDESTCPWCADWYKGKVEESRGNTDDFRLYYMENTMHGDVAWLENNMVTNYLGALQQALLDVSAWVEKGIEPLPDTEYRYENGQIYVPDNAKERRGMQPVVTLTANGETCLHVKAGEPVKLEAKALLPQGAGYISEVRFAPEELREFPSMADQKALNAYPVESDFEVIEEDGLAGAKAAYTYTYTEPGTHFASVRVRSTRSGKKDDTFTQVRNIARARIIVE